MGLNALLIVAILQPPVASRVTVDAFERAAAAAETFVDAACVLFDRYSDRFGCENQAGVELTGNYPARELEALTTHANPRVRTLALVKLFEQADPQSLPVIFTLVDDSADTFPAHAAVAFVYPKEVVRARQTVGAIAELMMRFYLEPAGYSYGSKPATTNCPGFPRYWEQRKDRTELASWLTVRLDRATQGTTPIRDHRGAAFAALRERVERLDGDRRLWYGLHVGAGTGGDRVFTESETLAFAKALGPDRLMPLLAAREPAFDPDLVPSGRPDSCGARDVGAKMRRFVLAHAAALLGPADADVLLQSAHAASALWAIAAAELRPDRAESILKSRIDAPGPDAWHWDDARMAAALVRIAGPAQAPYALDWFYGLPPQESMTTAQEIFMSEVVERSGRAGRVLLERLVLDSRFDTISPSALRWLVMTISRWLPSPLVEHPYESVPDEAATFATWRRLVRASTPRWK